jgi:hypothetical protein
MSNANGSLLGRLGIAHMGGVVYPFYRIAMGKADSGVTRITAVLER